MRLTLPAGWSSRGNRRGELDLLSPESEDDQVFSWIDTVAVTSTGEGHGTPRDDVRTGPDALIDWLTTDPDVGTVTPPAPATPGGRR